MMVYKDEVAERAIENYRLAQIKAQHAENEHSLRLKVLEIAAKLTVACPGADALEDVLTNAHALLKFVKGENDGNAA